MKTKIGKKETVNIITLGCSKNLVDSEVLMRQIDANGLKVLHDSNNNNAGTVIINTCGFIKDAKEESVNTILEFARMKEQGNIDQLFVMGCLSERYKKDLVNEIPEVDQYFGTNNLKDILKSLKIDYKHELIGERHQATDRHYAYLKISEGCSRYCSFCAIPLMRGKHQSKPIDLLVKEAQNLANKGVKELILIAQDLTYYGYDLYKKQRLYDLLQALTEVDGIEWIRLHYIYPLNFPFEVLKLIAENPKICKYLDVPFQHVSDEVLKKMRRGHTLKSSREFIDRVRQEIPEITLRTTLMVGHPGEDDNAFADLIEFIKDARFDRLGVFTYSEEEDTYGARNFKDDIPEDIKKQRQEEIMNLQACISLENNQAKIGKCFKTIIDRKENGLYIGRTEADSPEVDNEVIINGGNAQLETGTFYQVVIDRAEKFDLYGHLAH